MGLSPNMKAKKGRVLTGFTNAPPTLSITAGSAAPTEGVAEAGYTVDATDAESGDISASTTWSSDVDGGLGSGSPATLTFVTVGAHVLTAEATDSAGQTASATLAVTVAAA